MPDLSTQLDVLDANEVRYIELLKVDGKGVLDLSENEIREVAIWVTERGIGFSGIGSPLGNFPITGDFAVQLEGLKRALEYAEIVGAPFVRIFSFFIPEGQNGGGSRENRYRSGA